MRVLVACEFSQVVCKAFREKGHEAYSCDLIPCEGGHPEWHIQDDVLKHLEDGWDLMIAHPPCTYLSVSGARWFKISKDRIKAQDLAVKFFLELAFASIDKKAIENPVGIMSTRWRKPDQIIQPHQFGHSTTKATCLWLEGLPKLTPTKLVMPLYHNVHKEPPSPERGKIRSITYQGIAQAMAEQWG
jgi:site-specific DNA-cytosine methylase